MLGAYARYEISNNAWYPGIGSKNATKSHCLHQYFKVTGERPEIWVEVRLCPYMFSIVIPRLALGFTVSSPEIRVGIKIEGARGAVTRQAILRNVDLVVGLMVQQHPVVWKTAQHSVPTSV